MFIGVDLGGTTIKVGVVNGEGRILYQNARPTYAGRDYPLIIQDMIEQIEDAMDWAGVGLEAVKSIGIGVPGLAEVQTGNVIYCTNLSWFNIPLGREISQHFGKPVFVENDATVAALAEYVAGSTKGLKNSVFITLGTGVGGGVIINHKIYSGSHGAGSEIGHMIVGENFYNCNCGANGCLETFASATGLIKYVRKRLAERDVATNILRMANGRLEDIDAKIIFDGAKGGDALAQEAVHRMVKYLAIGIINIFNILDPERIAIGGGVSKVGDYLIDLLNQEVSKMTFCKEVTYGDIVLAELGNDAGIIGAAFLGENS
ncbi:ROK family protein [Thermotalea metallivorans]|uniref:Glucokinase n=1 Tax=Thermotalea metallivorans TaxID=520762 RepID=A0A140L0P3_9FIRM|nr:ROK family glucokinase [Thermotalea metallivorans]KXG74118.1 Glucokinase [Thermotalea metallivorans]